MLPPEEITLTLKMVAESLPLLSCHPMYQDITNICEVLTPIIMSFCYYIVGNKHNLFGTVAIEAVYKKCYNMPFIIPKKSFGIMKSSSTTQVKLLYTKLSHVTKPGSIVA